MAVSHISADGRDRLRAATSIHETLRDHLIKILYSKCPVKERLLNAWLCLGNTKVNQAKNAASSWLKKSDEYPMRRELCENFGGKNKIEFSQCHFSN